MNINTAFKSKFLKGAELEGDTVYTISHLAEENVGGADKEEMKPVLYFEETDKGLVLNRTNANTIQGLYGPETDDWTGKQITLFSTEVDFQGKQTLAIRVRIKKPGAAPAGKQAPASRPAATRPPITPTASKNPRAIAWSNFCDVTPSLEPDDRTEAWGAALAELYPDKAEKDLTKAEWDQFAQKVRDDYSEATGSFIPV